MLPPSQCQRRRLERPVEQTRPLRHAPSRFETGGLVRLGLRLPAPPSAGRSATPASAPCSVVPYPCRTGSIWRTPGLASPLLALAREPPYPRSTVRSWVTSREHSAQEARRNPALVWLSPYPTPFSQRLGRRTYLGIYGRLCFAAQRPLTARQTVSPRRRPPVPLAQCLPHPSRQQAPQRPERKARKACL